jgi:hypothetical protein
VRTGQYHGEWDYTSLPKAVADEAVEETIPEEPVKEQDQISSPLRVATMCGAQRGVGVRLVGGL